MEPETFRHLSSPPGLHARLQTLCKQHPSTSGLRYAAEVFENRFSYRIAGSNTVPPGAISRVGVKAIELSNQGKFITSGSMDSIFKNVLWDAQLPGWAADGVKQDLFEDGTYLVARPPTAWITIATEPLIYATWIASSSTFNPPAPAQSGAIRVDHTIMITKTDSKSRWTHKHSTNYEVSFVGAFYEVKPSLMWFKTQLNWTAWAEAIKAIEYRGDPVRSRYALRRALQPFVRDHFEDRFRYKWGADPPDYPGGPDCNKISTDVLIYREDGVVPGWSVNHVKQEILKGLSLSKWPGLEDRVAADIMFTLDGLVSSAPDRRTWETVKYDKKYNDENGCLYSLRINAIIEYYTVRTVLHYGDVGQLFYILWTGDAYWKTPITKQMYNDLVVRLCNNLIMIWKTPKITRETPRTRESLLKLLPACAEDEFTNMWGYVYRGAATTPNDSSGEELYAVSVSAEFDGDMTHDIVKLKQWITENILKSSAFSFFESVPGIQARLENQIIHWLSKSAVTTEGNNWGVSKYSHRAAAPSDDGKSIQVSGCAYYANGLARESGFTVKANFFHYTGVFYVVDAPISSADSRV